MDRDIAVVLGTRPEIIKLAPVIRALGNRALVVHTGQHHDRELSGQLFTELGLRDPDRVLTGIGGRSRSEQIGNGIRALAGLLAMDRPALVVVQGDTNSVSAAAQAANYVGVPLLHVEAGLRSGDRRMPEEINRRVTGVLADVHCVATAGNAANLRAEGVDPSRIVVTGNTIVEATRMALARGAPHIGRFFPGGVVPDQFVVATIHRPENTDGWRALDRVLSGLARIDATVVFLAHPRTRAAAERYGLLDALAELVVLESLPHHEFLALASRASLLVSDSGGLQEECTVLGVPLLVVRRSTERPESIAAGFARLVEPQDDIAGAANTVLADPRARSRLLGTPSPYGDGLAAVRIAQVACAVVDERPEDIDLLRLSTEQAETV